MSVVLFVSASAFTTAMSDSVNDSFGNVKYDILVYGFEDEFKNASPDELLDELKKNGGVEYVACSKASSIYMTLNKDDITKEYRGYSL